MTVLEEIAHECFFTGVMTGADNDDRKFNFSSLLLFPNSACLLPVHQLLTTAQNTKCTEQPPKYQMHTPKSQKQTPNTPKYQNSRLGPFASSYHLLNIEILISLNSPEFGDELELKSRIFESLFKAI